MRYKIGNYFVGDWLYTALYTNYDSRDVGSPHSHCGTIYTYKSKNRFYIRTNYNFSDQDCPITLLYKVYNPSSSFANMELAKQFVDNFFERLQKLNVFI